MPSGLSLHLGPLRSEQRVVAQFLVDRIAAAVNVAARRDDAARPRGSRRVEAVAALLAGRSGSASETTSGCSGNWTRSRCDLFRRRELRGGGRDGLGSAFAPVGNVHAAGLVSARRISLIAARGRAGPESLLSRVGEVKRRWRDESGGTASTLAISAPASGVARLPAAAREAEFVASLQAQPRFPHRVALVRLD